jgi:hypothetical protein
MPPAPARRAGPLTRVNPTSGRFSAPRGLILGRKTRSPTLHSPAASTATPNNLSALKPRYRRVNIVSLLVTMSDAFRQDPMQGLRGNWADALANDGWVLLRGIGCAELRGLLRMLGRQGTTQLLKPHSGGGTRRSLSGNHGLGAFPFHTDGAAQSRPPRYVAMWSPRPSDTATLLVDGTSRRLAQPVFENSWLVTPGAASASFYAVPRLRRRNRVEWRLNPDCMRPATARFSGLDIDALFASIEQIRITWAASDALVLNNYRMLHSREPVSQGDLTRELLRIQVHDDMVC